jgi:hypothetical protein
MHLEARKPGVIVGDPVPIFQRVLVTMIPGPIKAPGQDIVEAVLQNVFFVDPHKGFSATLENSTFQQIHTALTNSLKNHLGGILPHNKGAITPGFEDMLREPPASQPGPGVSTQTPSGTGRGQTERDAFEEALGAAFIDYFNGYSVDADLTEAFVGCGGTDTNIGLALESTFKLGFTTQMIQWEGPVASVAMSQFGKKFSSELNNIVITGGKPLDPVFADLVNLQ